MSHTCVRAVCCKARETGTCVRPASARTLFTSAASSRSKLVRSHALLKMGIGVAPPVTGTVDVGGAGYVGGKRGGWEGDVRGGGDGDLLGGEGRGLGAGRGLLTVLMLGNP
jgi:hypothetical protein